MKTITEKRVERGVKRFDHTCATVVGRKQQQRWFRMHLSKINIRKNYPIWFHEPYKMSANRDCRLPVGARVRKEEGDGKRAVALGLTSAPKMGRSRRGWRLTETQAGGDNQVVRSRRRRWLKWWGLMRILEMNVEEDERRKKQRYLKTCFRFQCLETEKRLKDIRPSLHQEEHAQTFLGLRSSKKQTHCNS